MKAAASSVGLDAAGIDTSLAAMEKAAADPAALATAADAAATMVSGAMAFAGTLAIGAAARSYFLRGGSIENAKAAFDGAKNKAETDADAEKPSRDWDIN